VLLYSPASATPVVRRSTRGIKKPRFRPEHEIALLKAVTAVWPFEKGRQGKLRKWQSIASGLSQWIGFVV
jgi:hypothetical protein